MNNLFEEEFEQEAITRIQKFAKIADKLGFEVAVGFSGGKDSQVVYDLCKRAGINFKAYYNVSFESNVTTTNENVRKLSTGVHDGKIIWNTSERITAMCIEDKHESEIFAIKNIDFATKPDDKKNPYKVYIKITFVYVGD